MGPPAAEPPAPTPPSTPPRRSAASRWIALGVAAVFLVAIVAAYLVYYRTVPGTQDNPTVNIAPHVTAYLSNGTTYVDIPLMTRYTAPALQNRDFASNASFAVSSRFGGPSTTYTFRWTNLSGTTEPVRFVLSPTVGYSLGTAFAPGPANGFLAFPGGNCTEPGQGQRWVSEGTAPDDQSVDHELWRMNYSVFRMAATVESVEQSWIQVNYSFLPVMGYVGDPLPAANVTAPVASDLLPPDGTTVYNLSKGQFVGALAEVHGFALPNTPFRHALPSVTIRAGSVGNLTVRLTSEFLWGPAEHLWLGWSVTAAHDLSFSTQYSLDLRFGSILVSFLP